MVFLDRYDRPWTPKYPGSLTVSPGDTCVFIKSATNPLWSHVKMDDDGRLGIISASRLVELPADAELENPSDDDVTDEAASLAAAAAEEQAAYDRDETEFVERTQAAEDAHMRAGSAEDEAPAAGQPAARKLHYLELGAWVQHTSGHYYTYYKGSEIIWWTGQGTGHSGETNEAVSF